MADVIRIAVAERDTGEHLVSDLCRASGLAIEKLGERLAPLAQLQPSWAEGRVTCRASGVVGSIQIGGLRVDVLPRLAAPELATLIRYALGGAPDTTGRSAIAAARISLDELLCRVFSEELTALRQRGFSRRYVERRERLPILRGRPDFLASFPWNDAGMATVACRYHELSCDNLDNQILRAALERVWTLEVTPATRRGLSEHRHAWAEIARLRNISSEDVAAAARSYTRLSEHYRLAHRLAELILLRRLPGAVFDSSETPTGCLRLDMALLYEMFIARLVASVARRRGWKVRSQETDSGALRDLEGSLYSRVRPDVTIYAGERPVCVIDAKYKEYWRARASGSPEDRVTNADLYQLFFYSQRAQQRYGLQSPLPALIVSPLPAEDERSVAVIADRFKTVRCGAGGVPCEVRLVLLPLTDILRRMAGGEPAEVAARSMADALWTLGRAS
jgi:5-methylcytosine-specific restriction enzyme subunit McrC